MHALLASVLLAALLALSGRAQAATRGEGVAPVAAASEELPAGGVSGGGDRDVDVPIGRCTEDPMSLAFDVESYEASRVEPETLTSPGGAILATPAPERVSPASPSDAIADAQRVVRAARPFTPVPRACTDTRDPRCAFNALPPVPERVSLEQCAHVAFLPAYCVPSIPAARSSERTVHYSPVYAEAGPHDAHVRPQWRPPRA